MRFAVNAAMNSSTWLDCHGTGDLKPITCAGGFVDFVGVSTRIPS
jgi:hypothetical protein